MKRRIVKPGYIASSPKTAKIHVSELRVGMYISELDRPWLETPFLMQGFTIEVMEDIEVVEQYCQHVWVEVREDTWVELEARVVLPSKKTTNASTNTSSTIQADHIKALGVYRQSSRLTKSLYHEVSLGDGIDTEQAKNTVDNCVQSILNDSDALMWMSRLRDEDEYTAEHSLNVCILAIAFGRGLGFSEDELQEIGLCGLLHDIGKMRVPINILNKPDKLSDEEFALMREHAIHGRNLLMNSKNMYHGVIDVAYSHHERIDGTGYPRQLKAGSITQYARMIAIVDAYDAMTAERVYAPSMITTDALKEIYNCRGTHFDEHLVLKFIKTVGLYPPGSIVELVSGEVAMVLRANYRYQHLPEIVRVLDADKNPVQHTLVNLAGFVDKTVGNELLIKRVHKTGSFGIQIIDYIEEGFNFG